MSTNSHQYFDDPAVSRLMGMTVALAGEVFVLTALNERLTRALLASGVLTVEQLEQIGDTPELQQWMARERCEFARALMEPLRKPNIARRFHAELFGEDGPNYDTQGEAEEPRMEARLESA